MISVFRKVTLALPADTDTPGFAEEEKSKPKETKIISGSGGLAKPEDVAIQIINDALVTRNLLRLKMTRKTLGFFLFDCRVKSFSLFRVWRVGC